MTDEQLADLERLARAATPGPWFCDASNVGCWVSRGTSHRDRGESVTDEVSFPDGAFIAAADPLAVLAMVAEVRRLRAEVAAERERCAAVVGRLAEPGCGCGECAAARDAAAEILGRPS